MNLSIRAVIDSDRDWVRQCTVEEWAGEFVVVHNKPIFPAQIDGFIAVDQTNKAGLITYQIAGDRCQIVTFHAFHQFSGVGTRLLATAINEAKRRQCKSLWLITTNDNLDALRFYQRRGFVLKAIYPDSVEPIRKLKPALPHTGNYGIPIRDQIELEIDLASKGNNA